jgi:hypothetical protein
VFSISAGLIWRLDSVDWPFPFLTTLGASENAEKYGHVIEHRAETLIVVLLMFSSFAALVAGATTVVVRRAIRQRTPQ